MEYPNRPHRQHLATAQAHPDSRYGERLGRSSPRPLKVMSSSTSNHNIHRSTISLRLSKRKTYNDR